MKDNILVVFKIIYICKFERFTLFFSALLSQNLKETPASVLKLQVCWVCLYQLVNLHTF